MPFEYFNPGPAPLQLSFPPPIGSIVVQPKGYVPTPEQEKDGITVKSLEQYVGVSWLHRTPPYLRRRLFQSHKVTVPEDLIAATRHLPEFSGVVAADSSGGSTVVPVQTTATVESPRHTEDQFYNRPADALESLQEMIDAKCSAPTSRKVKKNPMAP